MGRTVAIPAKSAYETVMLIAPYRYIVVLCIAGDAKLHPVSRRSGP